MRKIDYTKLAEIIMRIRLDTEDNYAGLIQENRLDVLDTVARLFAEESSVKKDEFLKACGVE